MSAAGGARKDAAAAALVLTLALAFQGSRGLWEPDEGRNASIALGMLRTGDWLVPRLHGLPYLDKPPLHFWTVAAGMRLAGADEWGARLGQAFWFAATAGLVGALGARLWDRATGRYAAVAYATSLLPFVAGGVLTPDTPLAACAAALVYAYWRADTAETPAARSLWWLLAGLAAGLGMLAKGPALLVLLPPLAVHATLRRRLGVALRAPGLWAGAALGLALALAWYVPVAVRLPGAAAYLLDSQVTGRLVTSTYRRNPGWAAALELYGPVLLAGTLPWSLWWAVAGRRLLPRPGSWPRRLAASPAALLLLLWLVLPLAVYLAASSRLPLYLLPLAAPWALATGRGLRLTARAGGSHCARRAAALALSCAGLLALKGAAAYGGLGRDSRLLAARIVAEAPPPPFGVLAVEVHAHALPLYGVRDFRWVSWRPNPYPLFTPLATLAEIVPSLAGSGRPQVVLVDPRQRSGVAAMLSGAGFSCRPRPQVARLDILICKAR